MAGIDQDRPPSSRPDIVMCTKHTPDGAPTLITLVEIKTCRDTDRGRQLEAAKRQHEQLIKELTTRRGDTHAPTVKIIPILVGVGGTIYKDHTIEALKELGATNLRAIACSRKIHTMLVKQMHTTVRTRRWLEHNQPG